jgi:hypothetical protein
VLIASLGGDPLDDHVDRLAAALSHVKCVKATGEGESRAAAMADFLGS